MASTWRYSVTLMDANSLKTTMNYILEESGIDIAAEFADAEVDRLGIKAELVSVTNATIYNEVLAYLIGGDAELPAHPSDITREAAVVCYLTPGGVTPKYHTIRIPDPTEALFEDDLLIVDKTNADLIAYVAELASSVSVSDGEAIDTDLSDGIAQGWFRSVKKSGR